MSSPRKFDHDEARARYAAGARIADLARDYGVHENAIRRVVIAGERERQLAYALRWRTGACESCGGPAMRLTPGSSKTQHNPDGRVLCITCRGIVRRTRLRFDDDGTLLAVRCDLRDCANGDRWQPPENFPRGVLFRDVREGGIHGTCRACQTKTRRAYREKRKVPCSHGCGRMVHHETAHGGPPSCHPCAMRAKRVAA